VIAQPQHLRIAVVAVDAVAGNFAEAIALGDVIVVMTQRPATVQRIIPVAREDRDRASPSYGRKLAETLECLGVKNENEEIP
jgi:ABC-type nitrate/sulfonate/bicarbonate transport system ATPase subunit